MVSERDPDLARRALDGLAAYERAPRNAAPLLRSEAFRLGPAALLDCGGSGRPAVLVPSLINPPRVLDLDGQVSLAAALSGMQRHVFLLDWGQAEDRRDLDVAAHVETLLVPLLEQLGEPAALVGYCLGGTMALAAANLVGVERVATLAAPWRFSAYPESGRSALERLWQRSKAAAHSLGALPMEVLQAAFWSLDPDRTVAKFAAFAALDPRSARAERFVSIEDWANEGEPLPYPAARELMEDLFERDLTGRGEWRAGGKLISPKPSVPLLHLTATKDRITPSESAPPGEQVRISAGHVGMVVGSAREGLHFELGRFLGGLPLTTPDAKRSRTHP